MHHSPGVGEGRSSTSAHRTPKDRTLRRLVAPPPYDEGVIDLHMHSTCSDGTDSPADLAGRVVAAGLRAAALTDHDTTAGHGQFAEVLAAHGIEFVPGVEISCKHLPSGSSTHVLCYFVDDGASTPIQALLAELRSDRATRNAALLEQLHALGYDRVNQSQIEGIANKPLGDAGRPHFATAVLEHYGLDNTDDLGEVPHHFLDNNDVFARLLGNDKPAYIPKAHVSIADAAQSAAASGAVAVVAHPIISFCKGGDRAWTLDAQRTYLTEIFEGLKADGVVGIETYYSRHTPEQVAMLEDLCDRFDFIPTGGSDFHGTVKPDLAVGIGVIEKKGTAEQLRVPDATVARLEGRRS
jgi:3',5'-nucleoside bisphosphate phosphatase